MHRCHRQITRESLMLRRLPAGLLATAAFVAPLTDSAQEGSAEDLGVMKINHKEAAHFMSAKRTNYTAI